MTDPLFSPFRLGPLQLENRVICLPMYLAYPDPDNEVNDLVLDYYSELAGSGAGMVVVENCTVEPRGLTNPRTLLISDDRFMPGLARLAAAIKARGVPAVLQLHHAGRHAKRPDRIAPSAVETWGFTPNVMDQADIDRVVAAFAAGARRAKAAGFDGVELHGGMGYLLTQFLSARTNLREDGYGGELAGRMRLPLEVFSAVRAAVGDEFPVGYRFLADECVPGGITLDETRPFAVELARAGATYLSVMVGCYDSPPHYTVDDGQEAFMAPFAAAIKKALPAVPVIAAGRLQRPETARTVLSDGAADLVGLGRVAFADPLWPRKARGEIAEPIKECVPGCSLCTKRIVEQKPAFCVRWSKERRERFLERVGG